MDEKPENKAVQNLPWSLGAIDSIEVRQAEIPKMPNAQELREQILSNVTTKIAVASV